MDSNQNKSVVEMLNSHIEQVRSAHIGAVLSEPVDL